MPTKAQAHLGICLGTDIEGIDDDAVDHIAAEHVNIGTLKIGSIGTVAQQHLKAVFR